MNTDSETSDSKWVGVEFRSYLSLVPMNKNRLSGMLKGSNYAHIHHYMPGGFNGPLPKVRFSKKNLR